MKGILKQYEIKSGKTEILTDKTVTPYTLKVTKEDISFMSDGEKVFINGRLATSSSKSIELGDTVSVRGYGRFRYVDILGDTRKGRIRVLCEIY